ncbi:hypothetical protein [Coleofasciculus sp.]|uniref:hypothetical protein n=1 Tax=Coleofasciculus sp. TaxID=3100458 RepID=UPI003A43C167
MQAFGYLVLKVTGVNPDVNKKEFVGFSDAKKHNALDDAKLAKAGYEKAAVG